MQNKLSVLQIDNKVLAQCAVEDIDREIDESEVITAWILDYRRRVKVSLKPVTEPAAAIASTLSPPTVSPALTSSTILHLPKLELQKFKGNVIGWTSFWDSFKSAVHDKPDISKIDKFNYLCSLWKVLLAR